jgi:hypothetical protein
MKYSCFPFFFAASKNLPYLQLCSGGIQSGVVDVQVSDTHELESANHFEVDPEAVLPTGRYSVTFSQIEYCSCQVGVNMQITSTCAPQHHC